MNETRITSDLLRGNTDTMILRLPCEADRYGYELVKLVAERSGGEYELKEATMYSSVRRLEAEGDITWCWGDESQGGRRKDFRITERGRAGVVRGDSGRRVRVCDAGVQTQGSLSRAGLPHSILGAGITNAAPRVCARCRIAMLVPEAGLEPARTCVQGFLRPQRLPFRHSGAPQSYHAVLRAAIAQCARLGG